MTDTVTVVLNGQPIAITGDAASVIKELQDQLETFMADKWTNVELTRAKIESQETVIAFRDAEIEALKEEIANENGFSLEDDRLREGLAEQELVDRINTDIALLEKAYDHYSGHAMGEAAQELRARITLFSDCLKALQSPAQGVATKGAMYCHEHGGYGFKSDCKDCLELQAAKGDSK